MATDIEIFPNCPQLARCRKCENTSVTEDSAQFKFILDYIFLPIRKFYQICEIVLQSPDVNQTI